MRQSFNLRVAPTLQPGNRCRARFRAEHSILRKYDDRGGVSIRGGWIKCDFPHVGDTRFDRKKL